MNDSATQPVQPTQPQINEPRQPQQTTIQPQTVSKQPESLKKKSWLKKVLLVTGVVVVGCSVIFILLAKRGIFVIPLFLLPKTTGQALSGQDCDNLTPLFKKNFCYKTAATNKKDHTLCERIVVSKEDETSRQNKSLCYNDIARITNNRTLCDKAGQFKSECLLETQ